MKWFGMFRRQPKADLDIAAEILFDQCYEKVFRTVYIITRDRELTEDAVQEGFYRAITKIDQLRDKSKFCNWATTIALNEARKIMAKNSKQFALTTVDILAAQRGNHGDPVYSAVSLKDEVESVLNQLSITDREILVLRYYLDLSVEEIAQVLEISPENAKVRLHRARQRYKAVDEARRNREAAGGMQHE